MCTLCQGHLQYAAQITTQEFHTLPRVYSTYLVGELKKKKKEALPNSSAVKTPPAMQETQVLSLGWEDPLEKGMATHSSILAWRIPWTREPGGLHSMASQRVGHK